MALKFETVAERLAQKKKVNIALFGAIGAGKTYAARTLDPSKTLFIDGEAGTLALGDWPGTTFDIRKQSIEMGVHPWELCRAIASILAGPEPSAKDGPYCAAEHAKYVAALGGAEQFAKFENIYVDSCTVASRWSFDWSQRQPEAFSEKTGKPDNRGAYGLHGREMVNWFTQLQHQPKNIVLSCILDERKDDFGRTVFEPQIVGSMAGRELPGIFDVVMTLAKFTTEDGKQYRAFVTEHGNKYGFPAKDRSGILDPLEEPNLGKLIAKIQGAKAGAMPALQPDAGIPPRQAPVQQTTIAGAAA